jgi:integrase
VARSSLSRLNQGHDPARSQAVERAEREKAKAQVATLTAAKTSLRLDDLAGRYWQEVGQHHAGAGGTWVGLTRVLEFFGKDKLLTDIGDDDVAKLVAWRRGHTRKGAFRKHVSDLISPHTVNHTSEQLRKLFTRAKLWGVRFQHEPIWRKHWLAVPAERVRELADDEAERLDAETRDDYRPFVAFARASGLRLGECLLRWDEVDWSARQIVKLGKGGRRVTVPITSTTREILWPLRGHHPEMVFTYIGLRSDGGKGERHPITYQGVLTEWRRLRKRAGVTGFRFHDFRHDFGTKLLRATGNLKLVQKAMNHSNIKTTLRYAHVLDSEVAEALERVQKSRTKSRTGLKIA